MRWFRFYAEAVHDPKVQRLPPDLFRAWVNCLCLAAQGDGVLPPTADVAYQLRLTEVDAERTLSDLRGAGLLDQTERGVEPHNWRGRQYLSDHSTDRVRRHRSRQGRKPVASAETDADGTVTAKTRYGNESATPPEQNRSRADTEQKQMQMQTQSRNSPTPCSLLQKT